MSQNIACPRLVTNDPDLKAEGDILLDDGTRIAYNTELVSCEGVSVHYWIGDREPTDALFTEIVGVARQTRDVVGRGTYSTGEPARYWARSMMPVAH
jgi:hypothetical protein